MTMCPFCGTDPCRWVTKPPLGVQHVQKAIDRDHHDKVISTMSELARVVWEFEAGLVKNNVAIPASLFDVWQRMKREADKAVGISQRVRELKEWRGLNFTEILGKNR